jgi:nucleoid-associated protein YgaU
VTVQQGDTLRSIAARFEGVSFEEIARHNNIQNPDLIYPGQVLNVPVRRQGGGW